jgi:hypothetical protein
MHRLDRSSAFDQALSQEIQQQWVARLFAQLAKVIGGGRQSFAEPPPPKAIGEHPPRQRMLGRRHPLGQP